MIPVPLTYPIFGQSDSKTVVPYNFYGQSGWFALPLGWPLVNNSDGTMTTTDPDTGKTYSCRTNIDGTVVFQDLYRYVASH